MVALLSSVYSLRRRDSAAEPFLNRSSVCYSLHPAARWTSRGNLREQQSRVSFFVPLKRKVRFYIILLRLVARRAGSHGAHTGIHRARKW